MTEVEAPPLSLADSEGGSASLTAFGLSKPGAKSLEDMRALVGTSASKPARGSTPYRDYMSGPSRLCVIVSRRAQL